MTEKTFKAIVFKSVISIIMFVSFLLCIYLLSKTPYLIGKITKFLLIIFDLIKDEFLKGLQ